MRVVATVCILLLSVCVSGTEHHTRHSLPKLLTPCPSSCQCIINDHYTETVNISCQSRSSLGIKLPPSLRSLHFVNVSTPFLQSTNLVPNNLGGSDMIEIVYKQSEVKGLSQSALVKLSYLEQLDLSENQISEIPATFFNGLVRLRVLNLKDNNLKVISKELFSDQQYLKELYLANNHIESIFCETFLNCTKLEVLDMSFNEILSISGKLSLNPSLVRLFLNNNKIKDIPDETFTGLSNLEVLNLANNEINRISNNLLKRLIKLEELDLQGNEIAELPKGVFEDLKNLQVLNISENPLVFLDSELLRTNLDLRTLDVRNTHISQIRAGFFAKLKRLRVLNASHNHRLGSIEDFKFISSNHLQYIDLSFNNLSTLPIFISHLEMVEQLKLDGNQLRCDCKSGWFVQWLSNHQHTISAPLTCDAEENMASKLASLDCEPPQAENNTLYEVLEFRSTVVLNCLFTGEPKPSITWVTPSGYIFHYYPRSNSTDIFSSHPRIHLYNLDPVAESRVKVLSNGSLQIQELLRQDAGIYTCVALNPVGNATSHIVVTLDLKTFYEIKIMCIIMGASSVVAVLICTAVGHFIYWLCTKCGLIEERSKQLMQLRDNIETYKSQQLKSLRENYAQQVHRIKQNCALQVEWIRDSYQGQVKHIRDFRQYGSHQFSSMRDQYYDQMKKVRDYSTTQLGWVRENYVFQRNRIQKFSSHQVLRFRESYKFQQHTLNKILENLPSLNLDNCRGSSCGRSESSVCVETKGDASVEVDARLEEMTELAALDERLDEQSVYYTPSELSESPLSPMKDFFRKQHHQFTLCPEAYSPDLDPLNRPGPSHSSMPWPDDDSPARVFHSSHSAIRDDLAVDEFHTPRTLQSSTSLPEMPQQCDPENSQETTL